MEAQSLSTCNQCGKTFQRKAHLLRHQQQHSGDRPYSCKFCAKTFKRSDVLRDHFSRCDRRGSAAIPNSLERGRKRHACDECSRLKVKCDNNVPCRKCTEFGRKCVKTRSAAVSSPENTPPQSSTPETGSDRNSIGFLLNCPGETDFMREFPKSSTLSPNNPPATFSGPLLLRDGFEHSIMTEPPVAAPAPPTYGQATPQAQGDTLDTFLSHLEFQTFEQATKNWQMPHEKAIPWSGQEVLDRGLLEQRAFDIREKLKYACVSHNPPHPPSKELLEAIDLITAANIAAYTKLYFRHWHKHGPMVHESSFNPCTAALPLVMALMSLGGMYSKEAEDVNKLRLLLDTIEAHIYSIPMLNDEYDIPGRVFIRQGEDAPAEWQQYQLEELQGAYLMIVLQYWTGNTIARARVRQARFTRIVSIFRHLHLECVQHSPSFRITDQKSYRSWIRKESFIRLATLAVMLDNAFGIFNNIPPRFQWSEIDLPFPSGDIYFHTPNYAAMAASNLFPQPKMKLKDAFLILFSPVEPGNENLIELRKGHLTALDMQMLIHFIYTHLWTLISSPLTHLIPFLLPSTTLPPMRLPSPLQPSNATLSPHPPHHASPRPSSPTPSLNSTQNISHLLTPFKTALHNWKSHWTHIRSSQPEAEWNKLGFQRTAETYFDAVMSLMVVYERRGGVFPRIESDCEKGVHLKRVLSL